MKKEKTVQLLEQLNCKMDKIIELLGKNVSVKTNLKIDMNEISSQLNQSLQRSLKSDDCESFVDACENIRDQSLV